jgi:hypothetical protein
MESLAAGALQGFSNATQQNNAVEIASIKRDTDFTIRELMDARVAERAAAADKNKYDRDRADVKADYDLKRTDTKADAETKHKYDLELMKERNKPYTTGARGSKGGARSVDFDRWKEDNPDGTWEEFQRLSVEIKSNKEKMIVDTTTKILDSAKKNFEDKTIEQARKEAEEIVSGVKQSATAPAKPFNLKDFQK